MGTFSLNWFGVGRQVTGRIKILLDIKKHDKRGCTEKRSFATSTFTFVFLSKESFVYPERFIQRHVSEFLLVTCPLPFSLANKFQSQIKHFTCSPPTNANLFQELLFHYLIAYESPDYGHLKITLEAFLSFIS